MVRLEYVAFDSYGIKSMCTKIYARDLNIMIDPGIAVETPRFPLPWHIIEELFAEYKKKIISAARDCKIVIITHYHYDHHICECNKKLYGKKTLLIKHPTSSINKSQRIRCDRFLNTIKPICTDIRFADGNTFKFNDTMIKFSKPFWHGRVNTQLGYVIWVVIEDTKKILYTSDLCGPVVDEYADLIIKESPDILIADGPPTYILGYMFSYKNLAKSIANLKRIIENVEFEYMILDHHLMRDYRYPNLLEDVYKLASQIGKKVCSAAELLGKEVEVLRGYRVYGLEKVKK